MPRTPKTKVGMDAELRKLVGIINEKPKGQERDELIALYWKGIQGRAEIVDIRDAIRKEMNISVLPGVHGIEQQQVEFPESIARAFGTEPGVGTPPLWWWGSRQGEGEAARRVGEFRHKFGRLPTPDEAQARADLSINGYFLWHRGCFPGYSDEATINKLYRIFQRNARRAAREDRSG